MRFALTAYKKAAQADPVEPTAYLFKKIQIFYGSTNCSILEYETQAVSAIMVISFLKAQLSSSNVSMAVENLRSILDFLQNDVFERLVQNSRHEKV